MENVAELHKKLYQEAKQLVLSLKTASRMQRASIEERLEDIKASLIGKMPPSSLDADFYPEHENPDFSRILASKKEFARYKYPREVKPFAEEVKDRCSFDKFNLSKNQRFLKNFMSPLTPYNGLLLYHSVGLGKTCSAISIAEQFKTVFDKPVFVLCSTNLKENFKKQILDVSKLQDINQIVDYDNVNQCTGNEYLKQIPDKHTISLELLEKKVNALINKQYKFMGFIEFSNYYDNLKKEVDKMERREERRQSILDDRLRDIFSNRVFIIDEVHNLRLASESSDKKVPPKVEHVLRVAQNMKLVMLSATPMFNSATEIMYLLKLLFLNDNRKPLETRQVFNERGQLTEEGARVLKKASRGYVSYMRGENPYAFPLNLTPDINGKKENNLMKEKDYPKLDMFNVPISPAQNVDLEGLRLVKSYMSNLQEKIYGRLERDIDRSRMERDEEDNINDDFNETRNDTDIQRAVQLSNIVYPSLEDVEDMQIKDLYGEQGFSRCFKITNKKDSFKCTYDKKILAKFGEFLSEDLIGEFSPKLKSIVDYINKSEGIVYIYSQFIYSGIIPLAIALEHCGFNKYGTANLVTGIQAKKSSPFKYIILSANKALSPNNDEYIKAVKSSNNREGEIIKVVIGSSVATEGIDFKRIREMHIVEPWYHLNKLEQIIGRAVRTCSHIELEPEKRNVTVYKHINTRHNSQRETIDVRMYRIAQGKKEQMDKVSLVLKRNSIDCFLTKNAVYYDPSLINHKLTLRTSQGTIVPNFVIGDPDDKERYTCYKENDTANLKLNDSTYDLYFIRDELDLFAKGVATLFKTGIAFNFKDIAKYIARLLGSQYDEEVLKVSLQHMIDSKWEVTAPSNEKGYIIYKSDKYIFQPKNKQNERITLGDRRMPTAIKRSKLDVSFMSASTDAVSKVGDYEQSLKLLQENTQAVLKNVAQSRKEFRTPALGFALDRMESAEYKAIVRGLVLKSNAKIPLKEFEKDVFESLVQSDCLYESPDAPGQITFFVNFYETGDNRFYMFKDDVSNRKDMFPCSKLELSNIKEMEILRGSQLKQKFSIAQAYVASDKENQPPKLKKKSGKEKSTGSVCATTWMFTVDIVKDWIVKMDGTMIQGNQKKNVLCDIYELLLRKLSPYAIARPYQSFLLNRKIESYKKLK